MTGVPTCSHTDDDIARTIEAFRDLRDTTGLALDANQLDLDRPYGTAARA